MLDARRLVPKGALTASQQRPVKDLMTWDIGLLRTFCCVVFTDMHVAKALSGDNPTRRRLPETAKHSTIKISPSNVVRCVCQFFPRARERAICWMRYSGRQYKYGKVECVCISGELTHTAVINHITLAAMKPVLLSLPIIVTS